MENAQKAIMIGVGLFITIIVIAAVMLITGLGQDLLNKGIDQTNSISSSLQAQITSDYDDATVTGSQVVAAVKRFYTTENLAILVVNVPVTGVTTSSTTNYGMVALANASSNETQVYGGSITKTGIGALSSSSAPTYIIPTSKYTSKVVRGGGSSVIGIVFTRTS